MKVELYGIKVNEGTPEEIAELKYRIDKQYHSSEYKFKYPYPNEYFIHPVIIGDPPPSTIKWNEITCKQDKNYCFGI